MHDLTLETFIAAQRDYESSQYHILSGLQKVRQEFAHNRIYPPLAELIELYGTLKQLTLTSEGLRKELPKRIRGIDLETKQLLYETFELDYDQMKSIEELIAWALPQIHLAIEEGKTIFNFVDSNLQVAEVGLIPSYIEEGYLLLPELKQRVLHVIRYEVTIYSGAGDQYRNLKTTSVERVPMESLTFSPGKVKLDLIAAYRDLPNPATYYFATDLDFPFLETILPVAKRKLLRRLYS